MATKPEERRQSAPTAQSDAVNQTLQAFGMLPEQIMKVKASARVAEEKNKKAKEKEQERKRAAYRAAHPFAMIPDSQIDQNIAIAENTPVFQLYQTSPVWNYPDEVRRYLGYYTDEEREQAARLNDARSTTVFGGLMPNFGRQVAYMNPEGEMNAFKSTALYTPDMVMMGTGFGLPSATRTALAGARQGWQTAGNAAQRAFNAGTQAVRAATPVVTNPRWATTTGSFVIPIAASAAENVANPRYNIWDHWENYALAGILGYQAGKYLLYKPGRWVYNKVRVPREPSGRPEMPEVVRRGEPPVPVIEPYPILEDFKNPPPGMPRPKEFDRVAPAYYPKPDPESPTYAKDLERYNKYIDELRAYNRALADYNTRQDVVAWREYDNDPYNIPAHEAAVNDYNLNAQSRFQERINRHLAEVENYRGAKERYETAVREYEAKPEYAAYKEALEKRRQLGSKVKDRAKKTGKWTLRHALGLSLVPLGAYSVYNMLHENNEPASVGTVGTEGTQFDSVPNNSNNTLDIRGAKINPEALEIIIQAMNGEDSLKTNPKEEFGIPE